MSINLEKLSNDFAERAKALGIVLTTAESCTAGLISSTVAETLISLLLAKDEEEKTKKAKDIFEIVVIFFIFFIYYYCFLPKRYQIYH